MGDSKLVFASEEIDAQFCYEGKDLGADCREGRTVFKVWRPLAERLCLRLYKDGTSPAYIEKEMERGEINARLRSIIPDYMLPGKVICVEKLPLNANGKIDRVALRQEYLG